MKNQSSPESVTFPAKSPSPECWFDDDMDYFVKTISGIKAKGVHADLIGSIITHYASKWLPDLSAGDMAEEGLTLTLTQFEEYSPESVTASWMKKRFFVETLVGVLPPEKDSIPCNFLLRLLKIANMVGVEATYRQELEKRISWQLDQASLKELVIPSFSHTCETLLDVELVTRLVKRFVSLDSSEGARSAAALVKVAKLVDSYLAEAAVDANFSLSEFVTLVGALPSHARATDDGLYRAIDTYLKAHPSVSKQERKGLCRLIDSRKLTPEASLHAAQNERFPVRGVIQVLLSEQSKLNRQKREINAQHMEIRKLKEDLYRLQSQCNAIQVQVEGMVEKKKGLFKWKKFGIHGFSKGEVDVVDKTEQELLEGEAEFGRHTPAASEMKTRLVSVKGKSPHKS
ncbi:NPH3 domain [Sesbania bispinosa]|nr:NPH3 domain [Sesbania bispinosa]